MADLVLRGGLVYDGLGNPGVVRDVAVDRDRVVAVGADLKAGERILNVAGLAVAPGFVDAHSHSDVASFLPDPQPFKLLQGVTTEIVGNCGFSHGLLAGFAEGQYQEEPTGSTAGRSAIIRTYLDRLEAAGPANHVATLVGHNSLRGLVNGTRAELVPGAFDEMARLASEAFAAGAVGLSAGPDYLPGVWASTGELEALALIAHRWNRVYATHGRAAAEMPDDAVDEAIEIAAGARVRLQYARCNVSSAATGAVLDRLHAARSAGVDARGDVNPYDSRATGLAALLPPIALTQGHYGLRTWLGDPEWRQRLRRIAEDPRPSTGHGRWHEVRPSQVLVAAISSQASQAVASLTY